MALKPRWIASGQRIPHIDIRKSSLAKAACGRTMALPQQCEDQALGYASGPMIGFDAPGMAREFSLAATEIPALLVTAGRTAPGNWPREPRLPPEAILSIV